MSTITSQPLFKRLFTKKSSLRFLCLVSLAVLVLGQYSQIASALSPDQLKVFHEGINYYDTEVCGNAGAATPTTVTAGNGTPTGLQFPNLDPNSMADAINQYIKKTNSSSELNGLGATLVASAKNANINPFLVVAIAQQESTLSDPGNYNVQHGSNSFGRTASSGQPSFQGSHSWYYWPSVKASVDYTDPVNQQGSNSDETAFLASEYGTFIQNNDLSGLVKKYDPIPSEYQQYIPSVTGWIKQMADAAGGQAQGVANPSDTPSASPSTCCPPGSDGVDPNAPLTGGSNSEKAYNFFVQNGFTPNQSAAIVGNMQQESGLNPTASDGMGNGGLVGFTAGPLRMASMTAWVTSHGEDPMSLKGQLDFVLWYITHSDPTIAHDVKAASSLHDASYAWLNDFERCLNYNTDPTGYACYEDKRIGYGQDVLTQFGGGAAGGPVSPSGGCQAPSNISPDCQSATGSAKILCAAKQYDPVSYVWGGGHQGGPAYHQACTSIGPGNSCGLDCSGLVSIAVYDAFNANLVQDTTAEAADNTHWQHVQLNQVQPGDLIQPDPGHVEIVDHVSGGRIYTFGAHDNSRPQPDQVSPTSYPADPNYVYLHWVGQGSS